MTSRIINRSVNFLYLIVHNLWPPVLSHTSEAQNQFFANHENEEIGILK